MDPLMIRIYSFRIYVVCSPWPPVQSIMRSNKSSNQFQTKSPLLPNLLASRILDLQLDYESKSLTKDHLLQLLRLYSQAIEFYEENSDQKHFVFQQRLSNVLKNPYSISILEQQAPNKIKAKQISQLTKTAQYGSTQEAHQLLSTFMNQKSKVASKIMKQIQGQKRQIIRRVMSKSFAKSFSTIPETKCSQGDSIDLIETQKQWRFQKSETKEKQQKYGQRLEEGELKQENRVTVQSDFLTLADSRAPNQLYPSPQKLKKVRICNL